MSGLPFDRVILHALEKPLSSDINLAETELDRSLRFVMRALGGPTVTDYFVGNGFKVLARSPASMVLDVTTGLGFQLNLSDVPSAIDSGNGPVPGLNDTEPFKPIPLLTQPSFTVPAAPTAPNTRVDIIEVRANRQIIDPESRQILDTLTGVFAAGTRNKTLSWTIDGLIGSVISPAASTQPLSYKVGVAGNPGAIPSTTPGYVKVAEINVGSGVTTISQTNINDLRRILPTLQGDKTLLIPAQFGQAAPPTNPANLDPIRYIADAIGGATGQGPRWDSNNVGAADMQFALPLHVGDLVREIVLNVRESSSAGDTVQMRILEWSFTTGTDNTTITQIGPTITSGISGNIVPLTLIEGVDAGFPFTIQANRLYYVNIRMTDNTDISAYGGYARYRPGQPT